MENNGYKLESEKRLTTLEVTVNEIKNNHLPHIEAKVDRIFWLLLTTLIGVLVQFLMKLTG